MGPLVKRLGGIVTFYWWSMKTKPLALYSVYAWLLLFSFIPLCLILSASFLSKDNAHLLTTPLTLQNYSLILSPVFAKIIARSILIATLTTLGCLFFAYPFSYLLVKSKRQSLLLILIIIPFWTSSLVRTYSLLSILKFKNRGHKCNFRFRNSNFCSFRFPVFYHHLNFF